MKTRYVLVLTAIAAALAASATPFVAEASGTLPPPGGGMLRTMPHGTYQCALPGDAAGDAYQVVEAEGFRIGAASSYRNDAGRGVYILRGVELTFTRGPKKGEQFRRVGTNQLQKMKDGALTKLLCTRLSGTG